MLESQVEAHLPSRKRKNDGKVLPAIPCRFLGLAAKRFASIPNIFGREKGELNPFDEELKRL